MTIGCTSPLDSPNGQASRRVSGLSQTFRENESAISSEEDESDVTSRMKLKRPLTIAIRRQVSNERIAEDASKVSGPGSPIRCVSEFDKVASTHGSVCPKENNDADEGTSSQPENCSRKGPAHPNPIHNAGFLLRHIKATRLEAELHPMRLILSRLISHPTLNRRGIFNVPVDPVALRLPDYFNVILKPMDLGTVKIRLHALSYQSRADVIADIRLVFHNAMKYNPPNNVVHTAARDMLSFFEEQLEAFAPESADQDVSAIFKFPVQTNDVTQAATIARTVSAEKQEVSELWTSAAVAGRVGRNAPSSPYCLSTRNSVSSEQLESALTNLPVRKRKKRGSLVNPSHSCQWCEGRTCAICSQGCLHLEPALLICSGTNCAGAKVRKGALYFIAPDGSRQYCQRCYTGLPAVLPATANDEVCRYKRDLLKRKNDEEVVEKWLTCTWCSASVHQVCAMHNESVYSEDGYVCPQCEVGDIVVESSAVAQALDTPPDTDGLFTFLTGSDTPVSLSSLMTNAFQDRILSAELLPETAESKFIQQKVRNIIATSGACSDSEKTVLIRVISDCSRFFKVPDVIRKHFRMQTGSDVLHETASPPLKVNYRSKAIALFQKTDGLDVCVYCMYVHEYDGDDEYEDQGDKQSVLSKKRVYIAYLDSVEHFRPRQCRTNVFHEILVSYLGSARHQGYEAAHIWACPPSRGNSFVFWNHPSSQRTPSHERLLAWYHGALSRAAECGVVTEVESLYETSFQATLEQTEGDQCDSSRRMICPPLLDGDFWIEEAVRVHGVNFARHMKVCPTTADPTAGSLARNGDNVRCPATDVATLLRDRIISHPSAEAFRRPVNAVAMKLKDYHNVIEKPMDLGTAYAKCVLGEYESLRHFVDDVDLVFENAKRFNPKGHFVHQRAIEVSERFHAELDLLSRAWSCDENSTWLSFASVSLSLDFSLERKSSSSSELTDDDAVIESSKKMNKQGSVVEGDSRTSKPLLEPCGTPTATQSYHKAQLQLIGGGPQAVEQRMIGNDTWMTDKRNTSPTKKPGIAKKTSHRRRKSFSSVAVDLPPLKRRRQNWLGEEVGSTVRRMRTSFFSCSLKQLPGTSNMERFQSYISGFDDDWESAATTARVADMRHALLEFCQFKNLEFDTLRRAKYSTAMILYHLHNDKAPGRVPTCTDCGNLIMDVRWHKISKIVERRRSTKHPPVGRKQTVPTPDFEPSDLCMACYSLKSNCEHFIPLQVSMKP